MNTDSPHNPIFGANIAEQNIYKTVGDGIRIEGAFAGFLYDLVDGPFDNDAYPGDDDPLQIAGSTLANVMHYCHLTDPDAGLLNGSDQLVYCLERAVNAGSGAPPNYQPSWRSHSGLYWETAPPPLPSASAIRNNWQYNLYYSTASP